MSFGRRAALVAAVSACALFGAAGAVRAQGFQGPATVYSQCDGYGEPSKSGDGMTSYAIVWGIFNPTNYGNTAQTTTAKGREGVKACEAALQAFKHDHHWMRKVSLLRAAALHHLETGEVRASLAALDRAAAEVREPDEPFYARSLALGLDLVRAKAMQMRGGGEAEYLALASSVADRRPYSRSAVLSAHMVIGGLAERPEGDALLRAAARLDPDYVDELFRVAYLDGRWAEVTALYHQLTPLQPDPRLPADDPVHQARERHRIETTWALRTSVYAYALAATGRHDEAVRAIAAGRDQLRAALTQEAPVKSAGHSASPRYAQRVAAERKRSAEVWATANEHLTAAVESILDTTAAKIAVRAEIDRDPRSVLARMRTEAIVPSDIEGRDMLKALKAALPASAPEQAGLSKLEASIPPRRPSLLPPPSALFAWMPEAESKDGLTPLRRRTGGFWGSIDGFTVAPLGSANRSGAREPGLISVQYRTVQGSGSLTEELVLMVAAEAALAAGREGFILLHRADIAHVTVTTHYGATVRSDPSGFETRLEILPVDPANPPERFAATPWRVIDAKHVLETLGPIFSTEAPAAKPARR